MKRILIFVLLLLSSPAWSKEWSWSGTASGGFQAHIHVSETSITLLDQLPVVVTLTYPEDYKADWKAVRSHLLFSTGYSDATFLLSSESIQQPKTEKGIVTQTATFLLSPLVAGTQTLTLLDIPFVSKDPKLPRVEIVSDLFQVHIAMPPQTKPEELIQAPLMTFDQAFPVDADASTRISLLHNLNSDENVSDFNQKRIPWIGLLAILAAIIFVLMPTKKAKEKKSIWELSPKQKALQELEEWEKALQTESYDIFYTGVADTLHKYIEAVYHIPVETRTTEEFLQELTLHPLFPQNTQEALKAFLEHADKVKYGHLPATTKEAQEALRLALEIIRSKG